MDYGQFYSARTIADASNTGRRLVYGNIRTDVTQVRTHLPQRFIIRPVGLFRDCRPSLTQGPFGVNTTACEAKPWSSSTQTCPVWFFFALPRELSLSDDDRLLAPEGTRSAPNRQRRVENGHLEMRGADGAGA